MLKERTIWNRVSTHFSIFFSFFSISSLLTDHAEISQILHSHRELLLTYEVPELRVYIQDIKIHSPNLHALPSRGDVI